jgi:hypothetical protein
LRLDLRRANGVRLGLQVIYVVSPEHIGNILAKILSALALLAVPLYDVNAYRHMLNRLSIARQGRDRKVIKVGI